MRTMTGCIWCEVGPEDDCTADCPSRAPQAPDFEPGRFALAEHRGASWTFKVVKRTAKMVTLQGMTDPEPFRAMVRTAPDGRLYAVVGRTPTGPLVAYPR